MEADILDYFKKFFFYNEFTVLALTERNIFIKLIMECTHVIDNVKIGCEVSNGLEITKNLECSVPECKVKEQVWLCLHCGIANCGRYMNAHAQQHAEKHDHHLCISCEIFSVYCYKCDDYISNDTKEKTIDKIRQFLMNITQNNFNDYAELPGNDDSNDTKTSSSNLVSVSSPPDSDSGVKNCSNFSSSSENLFNKDSSPGESKGSENSSYSLSASFSNTICSERISMDNNEGDSQNWKRGKTQSEETVRSLRPRARKRSHSQDNGCTENSSNLNLSHAHKKQFPANGKVLREKKVVGLKNLGNTCFMNAVLQSLSNIQEFSCYFSTLPSLEGKASNGRRVYHSRSYTKELHDVVMAEELRKILINLNAGGCGSKAAISPECLFMVIWKVVPRFRGYQQQDAHEFLRYMLDRLHTELLQLLPSDVSSMKDGTYFSLAQRGKTSIVTTVFGGILQSEVRCLACGTESKKHDPFLDLSLDIPDKFVPKRAGGASSSDEHGNSLPACSIADCLTSFIEVEELADTELYFCSSCKSKQKSTKRFWIRRLPNVLCLHIKRFRWNNVFRTKIDTNITFPIRALDMSHFVLSNLPETRRSGAGNNLYDLAAVIVHHGTGAGSGHYTAFAINDQQWFHFNDHTVRLTDVGTVASCKPYILFYIRREFSLPHHINAQSSDAQQTSAVTSEEQS